MKWKKMFSTWKPLEHVNRRIRIPSAFQVILRICQIFMLGYGNHPRENVSNCDVYQVKTFWTQSCQPEVAIWIECHILLDRDHSHLSE